MTNKARKASKRVIGDLLCTAAIGVAVSSVALGADVTSENLLKAMSDYMASQKSISFQYDSELQIVLADGQKVGLASSGTMEIGRPDRIRATRNGGFADVELNFDGKTLTLLGQDVNLYAQSKLDGSLDKLVDEIRSTYHRPVPAADLIMANPYNELTAGVKDMKDLGSGVIRGQECDHLAFRNEDVDWEIWIAQGDKPYPCRYVITSTKVEGAPQYRIDVSNWKASTDASSTDFTFQAPAGAKLVAPEELKDFDELPAFLRPQP